MVEALSLPLFIKLVEHLGTAVYTLPISNGKLERIFFFSFEDNQGK